MGWARTTTPRASIYADYVSSTNPIPINPALDRGVQAHWALSTGSAFFLKALGWNGFDNPGDTLRMLVDINNADVNKRHCVFSKPEKNISCSLKWKNPSLDVLSHEYGRTIVAHTAAFIYQGEERRARRVL